LDDKRAGFILEPGQIWQAACSGVGDRQNVQTEMAGSIINWDKMTVGNSIAMNAPNTANDVHIQRGQQGTRSL